MWQFSWQFVWKGVQEGLCTLPVIGLLPALLTLRLRGQPQWSTQLVAVQIYPAA